MSLIFKILENTAAEIKKVFDNEPFSALVPQYDFPWPNIVYSGAKFRRAHLDIIDARDTKGLYMMHLCIFPEVNDPAPIYGFDIIAGAKKVTGAFHDFSPITFDHKLLDYFTSQVSELEWSKPRALPEWAKPIFSDHMVAAGNITDPAELGTICDLALSNLVVYLGGIGEETHDDFSWEQNEYCIHQRMNPHTPRVLKSLGYDDEMVERFIKTALFPLYDE
jgi:hypothetical protein